LPAGKLEPNEPPQLTAHRELIEEAGADAAHWRSLGPLCQLTGFSPKTAPIPRNWAAFR
jgi:ADP-ribose pyrophosphatase